MSQAQSQDFTEQRKEMLRDIADMARSTRDIGRSRFSEATMSALAKVPRHEFVPAALKHRAYDNRPLPIGEGQTISQPYIVALMTDLLEPKPAHKVLEVGTGSGYQAAVLAEIAARVYTIEIVENLGKQAKETLNRLAYRNIEVKIGDGYAGWLEHAPFDGIIVTAAAEEVPPALVEQLKPGGRLVIPVGKQSETQELLVIEKNMDGKTATKRTIPVRFVPLTRSK